MFLYQIDKQKILQNNFEKKKIIIKTFFAIFKSVKSLASRKENVQFLDICWSSGQDVMSSEPYPKDQNFMYSKVAANVILQTSIPLNKLPG